MEEDRFAINSQSLDRFSHRGQRLGYRHRRVDLKAFQYVPLVIAQERAYMKEEGLELELVYVQNAAGLQALIANAGPFFGWR